MKTKDEYLELGNEEYYKSNFDLAIDAFNKALEIDPNYIDAWYNLGVAYRNKKEYDNAINAYKIVLKIDPKLHDTWKNLGNAYDDKKEYDNAIDAFKKAIQIDPNYIYAWNNLGTTYENKKEYDNAIEAYNKAIQIDPNYSDAWNGLGYAYNHKKEYDNAIDAFKKALQIDPQYTRAWNGLGIAYGNKKEYDNAIDAYNKALEIDPNYTYAWNNLGNAYDDIKEYDNASDAYKKAIQIDPNYISAWNNLGTTYENKKEYDNASDAFKKALEIDPQYIHAWYNLGSAYGNKKEYDNAIEAYNKALQIDNDYIHAWSGLGYVYMNQELYDKAIQHFNKALSLAYDDEFSWFGLGYGYWKKASPNYALAQMYFNRYLSIADELQNGAAIIDFYANYANAPYMCKRLFEPLATEGIDLLSGSLGSLDRQCHAIDTFLAFRQYLPLKDLDEQLITLKKELKQLKTDLTHAPNITAENDIRQALHEANEKLPLLAQEFEVLFRSKPPKTFQDWQLEALINYFMGNCIEAHRIYDEILDTHYADEMSLMDWYYYIESANQFFHPEAMYLLEDTLKNVVNGYFEQHPEVTDNATEWYYAAQIHLLAWQTTKDKAYLQKANALFLKKEFYLPAQYMSVYTSEQLGDKAQQQKQLDKIARSKEKWFSEGWKVRPFDFENPEIIRQFRRYAHFAEVQEAINLIHSQSEQKYRFPAFYEAFTFEITEATQTNYERFLKKRVELFNVSQLAEKLDKDVSIVFDGRAYILKEKVGSDLSIFSDVERSESPDALEQKLADFIFSWKIPVKPKDKVQTYTEIILYAAIMEKISFEVALRLIVYINLVASYQAANADSIIVQKVESTLFNFLLRTGAEAVVHHLSGGMEYTINALIVNFVGSFTNTLVEYRKNIFGGNETKLSSSESYQQFKECYLDYLDMYLKKQIANKRVGIPFIDSLEKEYKKQMKMLGK